MRPQAGFGLAAGVVLIAHATGQTLVGTSNVSGLSSCVVRCSNQVLARFDCSPSQPCYCNDTQLERELGACYETSGCSFADQLDATKYRASTCDLPVRDRRTLLAAVAYTLFGVAGLFTFARLLSRWSMFGGAGYGWDDLVAAFCLAPLTVMTVGDHFALRYGKGRDIWGLTNGNVSRFAMWYYVCMVMYVLVIFGTKISLVLLYIRIWYGKSTMRVVCWSTLALLTAAWAAFQVVVIIQCLPISFQWTRFVDLGARGTCINREAGVWALAGTEIGLNVLVILLPIPHLLKLKIPWPKRGGICSIFLIGLAVTGMSITRAFYIHGFTSSFNITYSWSFIGLYSSIEAYLCQVCCCMPGTAGLLRRTWKTASSNFSTLDSQEKIDNIRISAPIATVERHDFGSISSPTSGDDVEKGQDQLRHMSSIDSAPAPSIQRASHQSQILRHQDSFEPIIEQAPLQRQRQTFRSSATTAVRNSATTAIRNSAPTNYRDSGTDARTPDIVYHDHANQLKLEISDPPEEPLKAQLHYIDKNDGVHDLELRGRPRENFNSTRPHTARTSIRPNTAITTITRPGTAPSPRSATSYTTTNYSETSIESSEEPTPDEDVDVGPSVPMGMYPRLSALGQGGMLWGMEGRKEDVGDEEPMGTYPRLSAMGPGGVSLFGTGAKKGDREDIVRPVMEDRSKSEEEKLADLANAHDVLMEGGMI